MATNPFTPTFGVSPPVLIGRQRILDDFGASLDEGPGAPERASLYTGARGSGKTVMLNEVGFVSEARGWRVVHETADPGFTARLVGEHLPALLAETDPAGSGRTKLTRAGVGPLNASWETRERYAQASGLRSQMTTMLDFLESNGSGLLITLDEINQGNVDELRRFAATIQHLFREGREVAFAGAGLPSAVSSILSEEVLTFLERASRHVLGAVALDEAAAALARTFADGGRHLPRDLATRAADFTGGYPYMVQLTGYHLWRQSQDRAEVTEADLAPAFDKASSRVGSLVLAPTLNNLSEVDRTFLLAMARDDDSSSMKEVAKRMDRDGNYANVYRRRLIEAGVIESAGHGKVRFTNVRMRDYLRDHSAYEVVSRMPEDGDAPDA